MFHYVYLLVSKTFEKDVVENKPCMYLGIRSSKKAPYTDSYMGSGKLLPKTLSAKREQFNKFILQECSSRAAAFAVEETLCNFEWINNSLSLNIALGGAGCPEDKIAELSIISTKLWKLDSYREKHDNFSYLHIKDVYKRIGKSNKISHNTTEYKEKRANISKQLWMNSEYVDKQDNLSYLHTEEVAKKIGISNKISHNTSEFIEVKSKQMIDLWKTEEYKKNNDLSYLRTDEVKAKISIAAKKQWEATLTCPHCQREGRGPWMYQKHFKNCKLGG